MEAWSFEQLLRAAIGQGVLKAKAYEQIVDIKDTKNIFTDKDEDGNLLPTKLLWVDYVCQSGCEVLFIGASSRVDYVVATDVIRLHKSNSDRHHPMSIQFIKDRLGVNSPERIKGMTPTMFTHILPRTLNA
jgi:hypothetical protein